MKKTERPEVGKSERPKAILVQRLQRELRAQPNIPNLFQLTASCWRSTRPGNTFIRRQANNCGEIVANVIHVIKPNNPEGVEVE